MGQWKDRGSSNSRGYGAAWRRVRLIILKRDAYLCRCVECQPPPAIFPVRIREATQVDHRKQKADGGTDDESNLYAINVECHKRKTTRDQGKTPRRRTGLDGWPVDE